MIIKFLRGWHEIGQMDTENYLRHWQEVAMKAKKFDETLVVFAVPNLPTGMGSAIDFDTIEKIEALIQSEYKL